MADYEDVVSGGKHYTRKFIIDPLYEPEPGQEFAARIGPLPTPPNSASPTRPQFSFIRTSKRSQVNPVRSKFTEEEEEDLDQVDGRPLLKRILSRRSSVRSTRSNRSNSALSQRSPPPLSPQPVYHQPQPVQPILPKLTALERRASLHTSKPPLTRWNQGTLMTRSNTVASSRPSPNAMTTTADKDNSLRRASSLSVRSPTGPPHRDAEMSHHRYGGSESSSLPRRSASLRERYPGDMSARPLAMIQRDHRAANRAPHLHNHHRKQPSDTIDKLDHTGPLPELTYHHSGPYDATMRARNVNKHYSPVEAVKDSNMEALKATPREFIQDSLVKHVPLQGTSVVPPGMQDMSGRVMNYHEGADMMRDTGAPGGPYKRYDFIPYHDDDLKGKGEPYYTLDKERREQKARLRDSGVPSGTMVYEMQPRSPNPPEVPPKDFGVQHRERSVSNVAEASGTSWQNNSSKPLPNPAPYDISPNIQRSHSTGKSFAQSLKRRFGSLRRKKVIDEDYY